MLTDTPVATTVRTPRLRRSWSSSVPWKGVRPWKRVTTHSPSTGASTGTGACCGEPGSSGRSDLRVAASSRQFAVAPPPSGRRAMRQWNTGTLRARAAPRTRAMWPTVPWRRTASASAESVPPSPMMPSWHSIRRSAVREGSSRAARSMGTTGSRNGVEPSRVALEDLLLGAGRQIRPVVHDLHRVGELAVPVAVVRCVDHDVLTEAVDDVGDALLVRIAADEAAPGEEVLARLAIDQRRLLGGQLPMLVQPLEPRRQPAGAGLEEGDAQLREAMEDAAHRERHDGDHLADGVGEGVHLEPRLPAVDPERHLIDGLTAAVHAHRDAEVLGRLPHHVEARVVEVLLADVLGRDHADHAQLADAAAQLGGGRLGIDHRQLRHRHQALRRVARELRPAVVQGAAERDGEVAIEPGPLLARAAREHDGLIDALEVHVLEARLRVGHARALQAVQLGRALGLLDADAGEVGELLLDALAALLPLGLEGGGDAGLPVGQVAAVSVGVDDVGPEASHGSSPQWPPPSSKTPRARRPSSRSCSARSKSSRG